MWESSTPGWDLQAWASTWWESADEGGKGAGSATGSPSVWVPSRKGAGRGLRRSRAFRERKPPVGISEGKGSEVSSKDPAKWLKTPETMVPSLSLSSEPQPSPVRGRAGKARSLSNTYLPGPGGLVPPTPPPASRSRSKGRESCFPALRSAVGPSEHLIGLQAQGNSFRVPRLRGTPCTCSESQGQAPPSCSPLGCRSQRQAPA